MENKTYGSVSLSLREVQTGLVVLRVQKPIRVDVTGFTLIAVALESLDFSLRNFSPLTHSACVEVEDKRTGSTYYINM